MMVVQPYDALYARNSVIVTNGVVQVDPHKPFGVLIANFGKTPYRLSKNQVVGHLLPHPTAVLPSAISLADVLGVTVDSTEDDSSHKDDNPTAGTPENSSSDDKADDPPKIRSVDDLDLSHVDSTHRERLREMLRKFSPMWDGSLGEINTTQHHIDVTPGTRPLAQAPYRAGPRARQIEQAEVDRMLEAGVIEPSKSAWASPVVLVPKSDGSLRFCVDYRRLNASTIRDSYPLPRMDECIDSLGDATIFTTLDCNSGYWQIPVAPEDREKTAFVCHAGLYQYLRMPFGLTNAPATFQRTLDILLSSYKWRTCLVYLDDVIIFSKDVESHFKHVEEILTALQTAGVTLKLAKCDFFTDTVKYLGHVIRPGTLSVDDATKAALRKARYPRNQTELRSFLGLCNVYRRFIRDFAHTAAPLNALLKKGQPQELAPFGEAEKAAFRTLVEAVTSPPILALPKAGLPYSMDTDASEYQVGAALFQTHLDDERKPLGFFSRSLHAAEKNYSVSEKECLAVVWGVATLRPYLQGERFTIHTDHSALRWLMEIVDPSGRLMRWRLRLSEFDFEVKYKKGRLNTQADALSRLRTDGETTTEIDTDIPCFLLTDSSDGKEDSLDFLDLSYAEEDELLAVSAPTRDEQILTPVTREEFARHQLNDPFCVGIRSRINAGDRIPFKEDDSGVLVRVIEEHPQIVVPHELKPRVLHLAHYPATSGHPGGRKMYYTVRRDYYWPALAVDCYTTVRNCSECARERIQLRKNSKRMRLFPARRPLEEVSIDILGELIRTKRGNQYLLVITDRYSKLVRTVPLKRITAFSIAKAFVDHWVYVYGPPLSLLADNGKQFVARFFHEVCRILKIKNVFTTTYHPQTNGQVERFNRTMLAAIRHYLGDHPRDWDEYTHALTFAYNSQVHRSTQLAPFDLVLSRSPRSLSFEAKPDMTGVPEASFREQWLKRLEILMGTASKNLEKTQQRYKRDFDRRLGVPKRQPAKDGYVFVRKDHRDPKKGETHKLAPKASGPFRVIAVEKDTIVIEDGDNHERVSRDRVVPAPPPVSGTPPTRPARSQEQADVPLPRLKRQKADTQEDEQEDDLSSDDDIDEEESSEKEPVAARLRSRELGSEVDSTASSPRTKADEPQGTKRSSETDTRDHEVGSGSPRRFTSRDKSQAEIPLHKRLSASVLSPALATNRGLADLPQIPRQKPVRKKGIVQRTAIGGSPPPSGVGISAPPPQHGIPTEVASSGTATQRAASVSRQQGGKPHVTAYRGSVDRQSTRQKPPHLDGAVDDSTQEEGPTSSAIPPGVSANI